MEENQKFTLDEFTAPSYDEWKAAAIAALKGAPFEKKMLTKTYEGITLNPIYTKDDVRSLENSKKEFPGFAPFARSADFGGYKANPWKISQNIPYPNPAEFNKAALEDLKRGQNAINIYVNRNSFRSGVAQEKSCGMLIGGYGCIEAAFKGVDLTAVPVYFDAGSAAPAVAAVFYNYCKDNNIDAREIEGAFGFDPIGDLVKYGSLSKPLSWHYDAMAEFVKFCSREFPKMRPIGVNAATYHNAGSNAVQDCAYALATGVEYLRAMIEKGMNVNLAARSIRFSFAVGANFFMEISKLRVFRMLWSKAVKEFGGDEESQRAEIHVLTSLRNKTKFDPNVNMLRNTTEALSAALGGANSLHVAYYDHAYGLPEDFSRRISRNTQIVLQEEAHLLDTIDPAAGSYYIEVLSSVLAEKSWDLFVEIEKLDGFSGALVSGAPQAWTEEVAAKRQANLSSRADTLLGTNKYPNPLEKPIENVRDMSSYFAEFDKMMNEKGKDKNYDALINAHGWDVEMQLLLDTLKKGEPLRAVCEAVFGHSIAMEVKPMELRRDAAFFEAIREKSEAVKAKNGKAPEIHLINFGALRDFKARADFASDFFKVGGFEIVSTDGFKDVASAVAAAKSISPKVAVICSTDDKYTEFVPEFAKTMKATAPHTTLVLAGFPQDKVEEYRAAGVDEFIHVKANISEILTKLQSEAGIE